MVTGRGGAFSFLRGAVWQPHIVIVAEIDARTINVIRTEASTFISDREDTVIHSALKHIARLQIAQHNNDHFFIREKTI